MAHQLDDEEHVELGEEQGVDGEEVRGEDAVSLRGEELSPRGPVSRWRRSKTMLAEDAPDRARRDANAEGSKLALDADTTPAPVLATEPDDHFDELVDKRCRPGPRRLRHRLHLRFESSRCQRSRLCGVTMNEDQRSRGTKLENNAMRARVRPSESRTLDLAPEDRELVTQNQDLHVLGKGFHPADADQLEGATRQTIEERQGHAVSLLGASSHVKPGGGVIALFTHTSSPPCPLQEVPTCS